jgi:DNA repair protein RecO (recombination protein O)
MPAVHDQGVCIRHWDFSETSQTVSLFGRSLGIVRGLAKGARRERGAFDGGIDLLSRGEFGALLKRGKELATLTEWDLLELYPRLRTDIAANRAAFYMADVVGRMLEPEDPHPALYDRFVEALRILGAPLGAGEPAPDGAGALLAFQWALLGESGYRPGLHAVDAPFAEFLPQEGTLAAPDRASDGPRWKVRSSTVDRILAIDGAAPVPGDPGATDRANRLLAAYVRHVLGAEPPTMAPVFGALSA